MQCPHCLVDFHVNLRSLTIGSDKTGGWLLRFATCSACEKFVMSLGMGVPVYHPQFQGQITELRNEKNWRVYPAGTSRSRCPLEVPKDIADPYSEACLILELSPQASAALSRRCLQHIIRSAAGITGRDLNAEIDTLLATKTLPTHLAQDLDAVRVTGNFAAHPIKSQSTGEIVPVEPHEAEWNLEILESLFDFYYVQPAVAQKKREAMNKKLTDAGKPPLK